MTEPKKQSKKKTINWDEKSADDSCRFTRTIQKRNQDKNAALAQNSCSPTRQPLAMGLPLLRLRRKIKEVYDLKIDDEEEDKPLFNINLIEDEPDDEIENNPKQVYETIRITKQQQLTGKLNLIMDTALIAEEVGLSPKASKQDAELANSAEYDLKKVRKKTVKEKISKPLKLKGEVSEKNLPKAAKGLKKAKKELSDEALEDFLIDQADELIELDKEDMAKLILKKSGRKAPKKSLAEIAKGLNEFKNLEETETKDKE